MPKPSMLLILPRFPYPPIGGDKLKSFHLIQILSKSFELKLVCIAQNPLDKQALAFCKQHFTHYEIFQKSKFNHFCSMLKTLFSPLPLQVQYYYFNDVARSVKTLAKECDIVLNTLVRTAPYVESLQDKIKILDMVDSIFLNYNRSRKSSPSLLFRLYYTLEAKRLQKYEYQCVKHYNLTLFVNHLEAHYYKNFGNVLCIPNGVDSALLAPREKLPQYRHCIAFCGKMDYRPNIDAMQWFVSSVMPKLHPNITLLIIGTNPTKAVLKLQNKRIQVTGYLNDVHTPISSCFATIAPMQTGGGIQNKILEAMALEQIVITTTLGAKPILHAQDTTHLLVCDSADSMANTINAIYTTPQNYAHIGKNARELIATHYSWEQSGMLLTQALLGLTSNGGGAELESSSLYLVYCLYWVKNTKPSPSFAISFTSIINLNLGGYNAA